MTNSYNPNSEVEYVPWWHRTFLGIPYWLIVLILLVLLLWWLYRSNHLKGLGLPESSATGNYTFAQAPTVAPVSAASPYALGVTKTYYP